MSNATAIATLDAETRKNSGKGAARSLRREGKVPAVLYARGGESIGLTLQAEALRLQYLKGRFRSRLLELKLDGKSVKVLPRDVQFHPVTDVIEHVDFQQVKPGEALRVLVPVKFTGMDKSPGIKRGGVLNVVRHEIEFLCAPDSIPHHIEVNISEMDIGASVHINDLKIPDGISATIKRNFTVATVAGRSTQMDVEEEVKAPSADAVPTEGDIAAAAAAAAAGTTPGAPAAPADAAKGKKEEKK